MDVTEIAFVKTVGLERTEQGVLTLPLSTSTQNHLNSVHASAQFTLAETASGEALQQLFPSLVGKVIPVLRESNIRFRKPATSEVYAFPTVSEDTAARFEEQFARKGRASITVDVVVKDAEEAVTCSGSFNWFVQGVPKA